MKGQSLRRGNYEYATTRVKAKKSLLLTRDNYPKLLMMDPVEIGRFMGETQYKVEMAELAGRFSGVDLIELGTSRNLARVYHDILGFTSGELREMVAAYLGRWDLWNVKTIMRGKFYKATNEEIQEDLVPAGSMSEEFLNYLLTLEKIPDVLEAIRKEKGLKVPEEVLTSFERTGALAPIEDYLDKFYYSRLLESIKPDSKPKSIFLSFIEREIDIVNLGTLLRLKKAGLGVERIRPYLIEGGHELKMSEMLRLASIEDFNQMLDELSKLRFYEEIKDALQKVKETGTLSEVSISLRKFSAKEAEKFSHLYPLSVLPVIDYILRKKIEVDNIRAIVRGKVNGLDPEVIKRLLVM